MAESQKGEHFDYDLLVIGGGSGGLASSQEAAKLGVQKVAVVDFVKPTPQGTSWGLGGTCVNVGCIPKKLMHHAALLGEAMHDATHYGWNYDNKSHTWDKLVGAVQDHIGSLNWGYRTTLKDKGVQYINAWGRFIDPHTVELTTKANKKSTVRARNIILAVGGRPVYPDIPGAKEYAITSDDLFSLGRAPGKTLVVGASYVALECGGFLTGLGYDVTIMARSILLRGFDQEIAEMIGEYMNAHGTKFIRPAVPVKIEKLENEKLKVTYQHLTTKTEHSEEFDTVIMGIGRKAQTNSLDLEVAGVQYDKDGDGKIPVKNEQTNIPHIYALGDCIKGNLELAPVAIKAGRLLARRLYGGGKATLNYEQIPTTVFTPLEYGAVGLSEEDAIKRFGKDNIEVYHSYYKPLEWTVAEREDNVCYCKLIVDKSRNELVVGLHVLGIHAGEITQGFGVAIKCGATKAHFDETVGIHPTDAENFTTLDITKSSGQSAKKTGC